MFSVSKSPEHQINSNMLGKDRTRRKQNRNMHIITNWIKQIKLWKAYHTKTKHVQGLADGKDKAFACTPQQNTMKQNHYLQVHGWVKNCKIASVYLVTIRIMGYCLVLLYIFNAVRWSKTELIYTPRHGEKLLRNLLCLSVLDGDFTLYLIYIYCSASDL